MIKKKWLSLIGILVFIYIIFKINLGEALKILKEINYSIFIISIIIYFTYIIIRVFKWQYLMKIKKIRYGFIDSLQMYLVGMFLGLVTPGRIGDFSRIFYLQNDGYSTRKAIITVFLDRLSDLFFLFFFGYLAMFIFHEFFAKEIYSISIFLAILFIVIIISLMNKKTSQKIIKTIFNFFIPKRYQKKINIGFSDFLNEFKSFKKKNLADLFLITIISWIILYICYFIAAVSLGINIPFLYLVACMSISSIFTLIPISISGIGTRDAILIVLFAFISIEKETALAFSILVLFYMVLVALIGLLCWLKKPINKIKIELN